MSLVYAIAVLGVLGAVFGLVQGWLIAEFNMQPFIVTLAGQFFARGMTAIISRVHLAGVRADLCPARRIHLRGRGDRAGDAGCGHIGAEVHPIRPEHLRAGRK